MRLQEKNLSQRVTLWNRLLFIWFLFFQLIFDLDSMKVPLFKTSRLSPILQKNRVRCWNWKKGKFKECFLKSKYSMKYIYIYVWCNKYNLTYKHNVSFFWILNTFKLKWFFLLFYFYWGGYWKRLSVFPSAFFKYFL